jgi:hypothetical protein
MATVRKRIPHHSSDVGMDELWDDYVHMEKVLWLFPKFNELLADAEYFAHHVDKLKRAENHEQAGRYARAAVIFSLAAIEAASNDALVTIHDLLADSWPAECIGDPPWVYFRRLSPAPVTRLLKRGRLEKKVYYLLRRITSLRTVWEPGLDFDLYLRQLRQLVQVRNRIVHMKSLSQSKKIGSIFNPKQITFVANAGVETAKKYVSLLEESFSQMKLPLQTIK